MAVYVAQASCDERGRYTGGQAGNQSGTELNTRAWYPYGWKTVIRFNDPARAAKCAEVAAKAVANMAIGYDQGQRNTILPLAEAAGWDLAKVSKACECDCTSLAAVCAIAAGASKAVMYEGGNLAYTGNMAERMKRAADVSVFTSAAYTGSSAKLQAGDILVSGSHCVIVTSGAAQPSPAAGADIEALAKAVIAGRYGSGEQRKAALGASYEAVQRGGSTRCWPEPRTQPGLPPERPASSPARTRSSATGSTCARSPRPTPPRWPITPGAG